MVLVRDPPFHSLCMHHVLPFQGVAHVAYLPGDRIVGLSKLARAVEHFARDLQVQERLTRRSPTGSTRRWRPAASAWSSRPTPLHDAARRPQARQPHGHERAAWADARGRAHPRRVPRARAPPRRLPALRGLPPLAGAPGTPDNRRHEHRMQDLLGRARTRAAPRADRTRVRAQADGATVVDSTRALLVWEPRRVVPSYAVPVDGLARADAAPAPAGGDRRCRRRPASRDPVRRAHRRGRAGLDRRSRRAPASGSPTTTWPATSCSTSRAFDAWLEEDEPIAGHPRDPYHRVDVRRSSRPVRIEVDGEVVAETTRARLLFETNLPLRFYLPREDVLVAAAPERAADLLPLQGRGVLLVGRLAAAQRRPRLELRAAAARRRRDRRPGRVLGRAGRRRSSTASAARAPAAPIAAALRDEFGV